MKRFKFLMAFVFLLIGTLTVLGWSNDKYHKSAVFLECIKFNGPQPLLTSADILNSNYWNPMLENPFPTCLGGSYLCAICFDNFYLTANEARQTLYDFYRTNGVFPPNGSSIISFNGYPVKVYLKTAN